MVFYWLQPKKQRWSRGHKAWGQGQKKSEAQDSYISEDRTSRGQGQECSRPRPRNKDTSASALRKKRSSQKFFRRSPKKKRSSPKFCRRFPQKNFFQKIFQALNKILTIQKIVLSSSRGQANFRGLEASRPRRRTWPSRPRPRTSKCVLEAKDVLEDSTSAKYVECAPKIKNSCSVKKMFSPIVHVIITNKASVTILQSYVSLPRHICKRRVNPSHLCTPVDCQQFGKRSENVKGKLCLKVIIAIFPSLTTVLSLRDVAKTVYWVNWNRGARPPSSDEAFCGVLQSYLGNCKFGGKNVLIIGAVGPVRELAQNLRFLAWIPFFFLWRSPENW